jgi:hypothetical protein
MVGPSSLPSPAGTRGRWSSTSSRRDATPSSSAGPRRSQDNRDLPGPRCARRVPPPCTADPQRRGPPAHPRPRLGHRPEFRRRAHLAESGSSNLHTSSSPPQSAGVTALPRPILTRSRPATLVAKGARPRAHDRRLSTAAVSRNDDRNGRAPRAVRACMTDSTPLRRRGCHEALTVVLSSPSQGVAGRW